MEEGRKATGRHPKGAHILFLVIVFAIFCAFAVVFLFFPRTRYSELEKRDLAEFPSPVDYRDNISQYPSDISTWFSDSEPFRDFFMENSMKIRNSIGLKIGNPEETISYKPSEQTPAAVDGNAGSMGESLEAAGNPLANANAKTSNSGTIVVGSGDNVRALMAYGGTPKMGDNFVNAARQYAEELPGVQVYALVAPLATEFYLPEKAASLSNPQKPVIDYIHDNLPASVKMVDAYSYLAAHTHEDIYLRTDHHWAPLGGFYAAKAFAKTAGVPFRDLDSYDKKTIHRFVGSMYGYTKDIAVKNAPEDFVYYVPRGLDYKTTYISYKTDKDYRISSASAPYQGKFFHQFKDGSGNAYLTFMGGDQHLAKVVTGTPSTRRLLIVKDSYGNTLPGYMFYSFGEVHVVDFRYFLPNLIQYIKENQITDVLIAVNVFNAVSSTNMKRFSALLTQSGKTVPSSDNSHKQEKALTPATTSDIEDKNPTEAGQENKGKTESKQEMTQQSELHAGEEDSL